MRRRLIGLCALLLVGFGLLARRDYVKSKPKHVPQDERNLKLIAQARGSQSSLHRDFANSRFRYGDRLADVTAAYPPELELTSGEYITTLYDARQKNLENPYFDAFVVVSKEGKLVKVSQWGRHGDPVFFNGLNETEAGEWYKGFDIAYRKHLGLPLRPDQIEYSPVPPPRELMTPAP